MLTIILAIIVGALIYYYLIKPGSYWAEKGINYEAGWPIVGNMGAMIVRTKHMCEITNDIYNNHPNDRYVGMWFFNTPTLLLRDLELIKQIGIKDFENFHDHRPFEVNEADPLLSKSLITLTGQEWKDMRSTLSPAFTSSKMKNMYVLMAECAKNLCHQFQGKERFAVEMKDVLGKFAGDVIASTAFGIALDHTKDPENEFYGMSKKLLAQSFLQMVKLFTFQLCPPLARLLKFRALPEDVSTFFTSVIKNNIDKRTKDNIIRPDLIHLLMEARKGALKHEKEEEGKEGFATVEESHIGKTTTKMELTDEHIVAQAVLFFFAGFETISNATSLMAHELAAHPDIQKKLQEEVDSVREKYNGKVPYEAILSMKYMDQVLCETLRMWPPAIQTDRHCKEDFVIEPKNSNEKRLLLEKGIMTVIPIMALHRDPKYFPDPDQFDPERFNDENKSKILPNTYLPFGIGPRNCIGSRFAILEAKTLFFELLSQFDILPTEKTEIPLKLDPAKFNLSPKNGFQLALQRRK